MNTLFALLAEHGTAHIPLERIAGLLGYSAKEAKQRAARQALPIPVFRLGSQKSPWLVDAAVLAEYLDRVKAEAANDWSRVNAA